MQHIPREYAPSESSLTSLINKQESGAFQFEIPAGTSSRRVSTVHDNKPTIVKERSYPQTSCLLWSLPQKRSKQISTSGRVGEPEESHPRAFIGINSAKRSKDLIAPPLSSPLSSCDGVVTASLPQSLLNFSEAETVSPERADTAESTDHHLEIEPPKTLQSPFEYTQDLVASQVKPNAKKDPPCFDPKSRLLSRKSAGYIYFAPTNLSDKIEQSFDAHRRVPGRRLSYVVSPSKPVPRCLHKSTASWELRHEAERHAEDYIFESRSDSTLNASTARPYHSEPIRCKPRSRPDLSERKDEIQEAHAITIRTSPSKPQVICTSRRRATIDPFEKVTPVCHDQSLSILCPHTPPSSPASSEPGIGLGIESIIDRKYDEAYEGIKAKSKWTRTPPSSNPSSIGTVRRIPPDKSTPVRADTPRPTARDRLQLNELTSRIVMELEASVANNLQVNLQLDSPVILRICLPDGQRRYPRRTSPTLPRSHCLNFNGPLSSHPTYSSFNFSLQAEYAQMLPTPASNIRSLSIVFPQASPQVLSSLQATYLALHYIITIHLPSPSSCSSSCSGTETHSPLFPHMPYIPAKARAMLGLQTPTTRPYLPASWTRPETRRWKERIEDLECKLRREVVRLIQICEGGDLGKNEALVRAVGQIVECGQEDARRSR